MGDTTVNFTADYDIAKEQFRASELLYVDNETIPNNGNALDSNGLQALGLDSNQPFSVQTASNLEALKPSTLAVSGWPAPQVLN